MSKWARNSAWATKNRKRKKRVLVEHLGGACILCGYDKCIEALDFHHKPGVDKSFGIGSELNCGLEKLIPEVEKCVLLCANCHREIHAGVTQLVE